MLRPEFLFKELQKNGVGFFSGVPDSLLKNFCAYVTDNTGKKEHIIAANEGCAVGLAAGYHIATGGIPLVYMQNSGMGNMTNPLLSLADADVYNIPLILMIGWRGEPGVHDEPQHVKQGKVTCTLLEAMGIPYSVLPSEEDECIPILNECFEHLKNKGSPYALVVRKNTFDKYSLSKKEETWYDMTREEAIEAIVESIGDRDVIVSTTGMASRELYEIRDRRGEGHDRDFLTVGSMGHSSQIALGIAMNRDEGRVICIDGDGAMLMHMGGMSTITTIGPKNLTHIVINNGVHDSVGGQPTVSREVDVLSIAKAMGYDTVASVDDVPALKDAIGHAEGTAFIEVMVRKGNRDDLGRPKTTPVENKESLMKFIRGM